MTGDGDHSPHPPLGAAVSANKSSVAPAVTARDPPTAADATATSPARDKKSMIAEATMPARSRRGSRERSERKRFASWRRITGVFVQRASEHWRFLKRDDNGPLGLRGGHEASQKGRPVRPKGPPTSPGRPVGAIKRPLIKPKGRPAKPKRSSDVSRTSGWCHQTPFDQTKRSARQTKRSSDVSRTSGLRHEPTFHQTKSPARSTQRTI